MPMQTDLIGEKIEWRWWFEARFRLSYPPCAREEFECHFSCSPCAEELGRHFLLKVFVLLAQVSSAAILFAENRYTEQFFFSTEKNFLTKKKFFWGFFSSSWKTKYRNFQGEQKLRISAKMRKIGSTVSWKQHKKSLRMKMICLD